MINVWPCTLNPLKYELFHNFFLQVERMGPNELAFVQDIFCMKVLDLAEKQVGAHRGSSFSYAFLCIKLFKDRPSLLELFIAHLYKACPYTVPYYPVRKSGESDDSFLLRLGYKSTLEEQPKYLERMLGIIRLQYSFFVSSLLFTSDLV